MVELEHREAPIPELSEYLYNNPKPPVAEFDTLSFRPVKLAVKAALNADQNGLCVYCEKTLKPTEGQVEHIKPKAGANAYPHLCFEYTNYAHSCVNNLTCGQKKKDGILPIEPAPGCNSEWQLSTSGRIEPILGLTRTREHEVTKTRDMLGLNRDPALVDDRKRWLKNLKVILETEPASAESFLASAPYRFILKAL